MYGELCKPAVLHAVIGRVPLAEAALLEGYGRLRDPDSGYFRAVPRAGAVTPGLLLGDIGADELEALDRFENVAGEEYRRIEVEVETLADRRRRPAWVYV